MDDSKRSLLPALLVGLLAAGMVFASDWLFPKHTTTPSGGRATTAATATQHGLSSADRAARARADRRVSITTRDFVATFTSRNAALVSFTLSGPRFRDARGHHEQLVTTELEEYLPLAMQIRGVDVPADATWRAEQDGPSAVRFTWEGNGFRVVRKIEAGRGSYQLWSTVRVENLGNSPRPVRLVDTLHHYVTRASEESGGFIGRPSPKVTRGACANADESIRLDRSKLLDARGLGPNVHFVGLENTYFALALTTENADAERCVLGAEDRFAGGEEAHGSLFRAELLHRRQMVAPHESATFRTVAYFGPKDLSALTAVGHHFDELVDLGFFSFIARGLLKLVSAIHGVVLNWGLAIILLTFLVKLLLYPLTERSFQSMAKMRMLKPEMDRINELYANDSERKGAEIMKLYRDYKINPMAGCLPSLLQMPVWFALYQSLSTNIELYHAPFVGYLRDLSSPDPYFVLPLFLGGLMYLQQRITPNTLDPVQAKVMLYMMPTMITAFMLFLPAGLCVYMITNSTLGIAQQQFIQWRLDRQPPATPSTAAEAAPAGDSASPGGAGEGKPGSRGNKGTKRGRA